MRKLILLFLFLFFVPLVFAQLSVEDTPVKNTILPDEAAVFSLTLHNPDTSDTYGVALSDSNWRLKGTTQVEVPSKGEKKIELQLVPLGVIKPGQYIVTVRVFSLKDSNDFVDHPLLIKVIAFTDLVDAQLEYNPQGLDPRKENLIRVNLKNKNNIQLDDITLSLQSELFSAERTISLLPLESRSEQVTVNFDSFVEKGEYDVRVLVTLEKDVLVDRTERVAVGYYNDVTQDLVIDDGFLTKTTRLLRENKGNTPSKEEYTLRLSSFEKTFTRFTPQATSVEKQNGLYYYIWKFDISPGGTYRIEIFTNYFYPLLGIIVVILVLWLIYTFVRSDVSLKKKVLTIKSGESISDIKVLLVVKNRGKPLSHLQVMDKIPHLMKQPQEYGTIKPHKVRKDSMGVVLTWNLENLVKNEERIISYRIKSHVPVIGKIMIPQALARYRGTSKRLHIVKSNKISLLS